MNFKGSTHLPNTSMQVLHRLRESRHGSHPRCHMHVCTRPTLRGGSVGPVLTRARPTFSTLPSSCSSRTHFPPQDCDGMLSGPATWMTHRDVLCSDRRCGPRQAVLKYPNALEEDKGLRLKSEPRICLLLDSRHHLDDASAAITAITRVFRVTLLWLEIMWASSHLIQHLGDFNQGPRLSLPGRVSCTLRLVPFLVTGC